MSEPFLYSLHGQLKTAVGAPVERAFKRAVNSLYETARKQPDPDATADRNAVAAAMKGYSGSPPPEQPVNLGNLSNAEFNQLIREKYGINSGV